MLRIMTLNVNGIRSAAKKGLFNWLHEQAFDVVCLQEVRAQQDQLNEPIYNPEGYHVYYVEAEKKGYSGVAIYSRIKPQNVITQLGFDLADQEGRYVQLDFKDLSIVSLYLPSGTSGDDRQQQKYHFMDVYGKILIEQRKNHRDYIICGDWNIAHQKIDLKNWQSNQKNSGFLPEERAWLDQLFNEQGFMDAFRMVNQEAEQYTWWSNRGQAWAKNVGWRIDYHIVTDRLASAIKSAEIYKAERFSDHAPLTIEYDLLLKTG